MSTKVKTQEYRVDSFKSSTVKKTLFNYTDQELKIYFKSGDVYSYMGVDVDTYLTMVYSDSIGQAFNTLIKPNFKTIKLADPIFTP